MAAAKMTIVTAADVDDGCGGDGDDGGGHTYNNQLIAAAEKMAEAATAMASVMATVMATATGRMRYSRGQR